MGQAHARYLRHGGGTVADYLPILAQANPGWFGISVASADGQVYGVGDVTQGFSIQAISKAFVYALVCEAFGHEQVLDLVGVNNTGLPFNSVIAVELNDGHPLNPMVNAGALATTALLPGESSDQKWQHLLAGLSAFAGRELSVDGCRPGAGWRCCGNHRARARGINRRELPRCTTGHRD